MAHDLARTVLGASFQNPVLLAAGTAGFGREVAGVMDLERLGGLVTKAVSPEPRAGNRAPRVAEFPFGMLNSVGLANPGLAAVRQAEFPWLEANLRRARVLVNVVGFTAIDFAEVVAGLDHLTGITAFELNLSCPNTHAGGLEFGADPATVTEVLRLCRMRTRKPLLAKLSPALPDIAGMAIVARDAGAAGVSVVNTLPGYLSDNRGGARLGNGNGGVSGPALLPVGVLAVRRIMERSGGMTVIGIGGIRSGDDARQYLRAGAALVAIGTAALADPRIPEQVVADLSVAVADIIVALDLPGAEARELLGKIPEVRWVKVGSILFTEEGPALVRELACRGLSVFLDLKWHDIPTTVAGAVQRARDLGVAMATVHTLGGADMLKAAAQAAGPELGLVGVTVLTSHTPHGYAGTVGRDLLTLLEEVNRLADIAFESGLKGVVCSPHEVAAVGRRAPAGSWIVVPGIRRPGDPAGDQSRIAGPKEAVGLGATHLVVGRPIIHAADPGAVFRELQAAAR